MNLGMPTIDISKYVVSKDVFDQHSAEIWVQSEDHIITITSNEETVIIEKLLDIPAGEPELGPSQLKRPKGGEACSSCGRQYTFLDITNTAASGGVHDKQFLKDIITGAHGYVYNVGTVQRISCYNCGIDGIRPYSGCYKTNYYQSCYDC